MRDACIALAKRFACAELGQGLRFDVRACTVAYLLRNLLLLISGEGSKLVEFGPN